MSGLVHATVYTVNPRMIRDLLAIQLTCAYTCDLLYFQPTYDTRPVSSETRVCPFKQCFSSFVIFILFESCLVGILVSSVGA